MLAVIKDPQKSGIKLENVPIPEVDPDGILIKVKAVGICGSDLRLYREENPNKKGSFILGHELSGEVVSWGQKVKGFKKGNEVATEICIGCGECEYCRKNLINLCNELEEIGVTQDGGMAEYICAPAKNVHKLPQGVSFTEATLADPLACVLRGFELLKVKPNSWVAILGPGTMGLLATQVVKNILKGKVIIVGVKGDEERLAWAGRFGADELVNISGADPIATVMEITGGGAHYTFEATGVPPALSQAFAMTRKSGSVVVMTVHKRIEVDMEPLIRKELRIFGSICYNHQVFSRALNLIAEGGVEVKLFTKHTFPLREAEEAFNSVLSRQGIKAILIPY